ncbi:MAG: HPr family phosphocarrier protein [Oligoflexia bacterium]|nr:HPr family phosphocarrier protein [Oligoflexia bacterium]
MEERKIKILNEEGMHARPAGVFAKMASTYQSKVSVLFNGKAVNGKSSISLMTLGLVKDSEVTIQVDGADAVELADKLTTLINNKFLME